MRNLLTVLNGLLFGVAMTMGAPLAWSGTPAATATVWGDPHAGSAYLGVHIDDVTPERAAALKLADPSGAVITDLDQDGPACKAGLKENDVIVIFNGSKVANPSELANLIHATAAGSTVPLVVIRDGQKKDVKVTLGNLGAIVARANAGGRPTTAMPPIHFSGGMAPDIEIPSVTALSARHGIVVESLSPQLGDFFGVPRGSGVLVRSVAKGSSAETAGLKAGDVIVKVNGEPVHDIVDWRHTLHGRSGKTSISFIRDKHEQTVDVTLPGPPDTSWLGDFDWEGLNSQEFEKNMQAFQQEMQKLRPELERSQKEIIASIKPNQKELEQMQRDLQKSLKLSQKDIEKMTRDLQKSMPSEKQMAEMRSQIEKSMPTQKQMEEMRRQVEESMKNFTPQFQQQLQEQMQEMKKQLEQQQHQWQDMLKGQDSEREF